MTVAELITRLQKENPDRIVIMSKDSEGNYYSPLYGSYCGAYVPDSTWGGEVGLETLTESDIIQGYADEDVKHGGQPALILVPVN